jgi:predicted DsbA family dithiol-disulfide isomerase
MSEIADLLARLRAGSMSLEEVATRFRDRQWPARGAAPSGDAHEAFAAEERDPEPLLEDSFEEVHAAYMRHELTKDQYAVLAKAAAEAGQGS